MAIEEVEQANARFYKAFEECSTAAMDQVWLQADWVRCIHPGSEIVVGWKEVRNSWAEIFSSTKSIKLSISNLFIKVVGDMAWVECLENIATFFEHGFTSGQVQSTNIFLRTEDGWKMIHHHASLLPADVPDDWDEDILH
ncbi:MAG: nuclear transport factor 2 family protein [Acidobacteriota bacterium]|nr:nuclear transport factor 2 family protein [Blastocatellia bacterium]MDW8412078.1 nuclear transport factor 2 family protein [Acidobacteriota bacterium]